MNNGGSFIQAIFNNIYQHILDLAKLTSFKFIPLNEWKIQILVELDYL